MIPGVCLTSVASLSLVRGVRGSPASVLDGLYSAAAATWDPKPGFLPEPGFNFIFLPKSRILRPKILAGREI